MKKILTLNSAYKDGDPQAELRLLETVALKPDTGSSCGKFIGLINRTLSVVCTTFASKSRFQASAGNCNFSILY